MLFMGVCGHFMSSLFRPKVIFIDNPRLFTKEWAAKKIGFLPKTPAELINTVLEALFPPDCNTGGWNHLFRRINLSILGHGK